MYPISFLPRFECQVNKFYLDSRGNNISIFTSIRNYEEFLMINPIPLISWTFTNRVTKILKYLKLDFDKFLFIHFLKFVIFHVNTLKYLLFMLNQVTQYFSCYVFILSLINLTLKVNLSKPFTWKILFYSFKNGKEA